MIYSKIFDTKDPNMKLQEGKRYWQRGGKLSGVLRCNDYVFFCFSDGVLSYREDGRALNFHKSNLDLIEEFDFHNHEHKDRLHKLIETDKITMSEFLDICKEQSNKLKQKPMTQPTEQQIKAAAEKCPEAKVVLKELYPDVFKEGIKITENDLGFFINKQPIAIMVRSNGKFEDKSLYLDSRFNWFVEKDDEGVQCLIPTRK